MKKLLLATLISILFLQIVNAETQIFTGKVKTDTDKAVEGGIFRFKYDESSNKVFVTTPSTNMIIDNGACKSNDLFRVCINSANFSDKNVTTYVYYYDVDVTIYKLTGSLTTSSKVVLGTLLPGEATDLTVTITNPTEFEITNIDYKQNLTSFIIKELKGCSIDQGNMIWKGSLKSKYDKICTATIIAEEAGTFSIAGDLSYFNSYETEKTTTEAATIIVLPKQLNVSRSIDKDIEVKRPFYINYSIQNRHSTEKMDISITIEIPNTIALLKEPTQLNKDLNILRRSLILDPGSFLNFSLYLEASADYNLIREKYNSAIKDIRDTLEDSISIYALEPKPIINLTSEFNELTPGQKFIVFAKLKNPSKVYDLKNIIAKLSAPYNNEIVQKLNKLMPNETYTIISNSLILPEEVGLSNVTLNLEIYYTLEEVAKSSNKSLELKVKQEQITVERTAPQPEQITATANATERPASAPSESNVTQQATTQTEMPKTEMVLTFDETKSKLSNKKALYIGISILIAMFILAVIIYKIGQGRKGNKPTTMPVSPQTPQNPNIQNQNNQNQFNQRQF